VELASTLVTIARNIDDAIIDRALQPAINLAAWYLGLPLYTIAKACVVLGAGTGLIWLHRFDQFPSVGFYQDMLCLGIMVIATYFQVRIHESHAPKRPAIAPAARATGLLWRTAWLLDLALFPLQWPTEPHAELGCNFIWTLMLVLPYWIICCHQPPPLERRHTATLRPVTVPARG
jgi:hypothetical protein